MTIENWKPTTGGKRVGTFDLTMPSGIVLKQCSLVKWLCHLIHVLKEIPRKMEIERKGGNGKEGQD